MHNDVGSSLFVPLSPLRKMTRPAALIELPGHPSRPEQEVETAPANRLVDVQPGLDRLMGQMMERPVEFDVALAAGMTERPLQCCPAVLTMRVLRCGGEVARHGRRLSGSDKTFNKEFLTIARSANRT